MNSKHDKLVNYTMIENDKSCREKRKGEVRGEEGSRCGAAADAVEHI